MYQPDARAIAKRRQRERHGQRRPERQQHVRHGQAAKTDEAQGRGEDDATIDCRAAVEELEPQPDRGDQGQERDQS